MVAPGGWPPLEPMRLLSRFRSALVNTCTHRDGCGALTLALSLTLSKTLTLTLTLAKTLTLTLTLAPTLTLHTEIAVEL